MHLERTASLVTPPEDVRNLWSVLARLRWRLGLERGLIFALRGLMASAGALMLISIAQWLGLPIDPMLAGLPVALAVALAVARWPSRRRTAETADRRLALAERLATAVEISSQGWRAGRFDRLQVHDAVLSVTSARAKWLAIDGRARREVAVAIVLIVAALASRLILDVPRPVLPVGEQAQDASAVQTDQDRAASDSAQDLLNVGPPSGVTAVPKHASDPSLASKVQQAQAEQDALNRLSSALGQVSAGQPAANDIQRGDYSGASNELSNLGEQADQLTDAAKQALAQSLQSAANGTSGDQQLAERERQAAQALSKSTYAEQRQALQQLGQQLGRSASGSMPADQLARDIGQLQQQGGSGAQGSNGSGAAASSSAQGSAGRGSGGSGDGQQGGPGVGTGSGGDPLGESNPRLETAGQRVDVPTKLGQGLAVRPPDGTEDQTGSNPSAGARTVSEASQPQQTGQVVPEQNLVPGGQRPVVRGYFR